MFDKKAPVYSGGDEKLREITDYLNYLREQMRVLAAKIAKAGE